MCIRTARTGIAPAGWSRRTAPCVAGPAGSRRNGRRRRSRRSRFRRNRCTAPGRPVDPTAPAGAAVRLPEAAALLTAAVELAPRPGLLVPAPWLSAAPAGRWPRFVAAGPAEPVSAPRHKSPLAAICFAERPVRHTPPWAPWLDMPGRRATPTLLPPKLGAAARHWLALPAPRQPMAALEKLPDSSAFGEAMRTSSAHTPRRRRREQSRGPPIARRRSFAESVMAFGAILMGIFVGKGEVF